MSHQTGIKASPSLKALFIEAKDEQSHHRVIKVTIDTLSDPEQLVECGLESASGTWENDFDKVGTLLKDKEACYVFYKFDRNPEDEVTKWLLVIYIPDNAPVRSKMLFASTKSTLKTEFGGAQFIVDEVNATIKSELTYNGYQDHVEHKAAPVPLSLEEMEIQRIKESEVRTDVSVDTKHQTMQGLAFPMSDASKDALMMLKEGRVTYVQLTLDIERETVELGATETVDTNGLRRVVPDKGSTYNFFCFKHTHEGDYKEDIVFIYSMGGYSSSIKERMLYSSCKSPCLAAVEEGLGIEIVKKIEIDSEDPITEAFLMDAVHPIRNVHRSKFEKPKGPGGRAGPRRMIKGDK